MWKRDDLKVTERKARKLHDDYMRAFQARNGTRQGLTTDLVVYMESEGYKRNYTRGAPLPKGKWWANSKYGAEIVPNNAGNWGVPLYGYMTQRRDPLKAKTRLAVMVLPICVYSKESLYSLAYIDKCRAEGRQPDATELNKTHKPYRMGWIVAKGIATIDPKCWGLVVKFVISNTLHRTKRKQDAIDYLENMEEIND